MQGAWFIQPEVTSPSLKPLDLSYIICFIFALPPIIWDLL